MNWNNLSLLFSKLINFTYVFPSTIDLKRKSGFGMHKIQRSCISSDDLKVREQD